MHPATDERPPWNCLTPPLPSHSIANARVGLSGDTWSASFFIDNLANQVAEITANNTSFQFNIPYVVR